MDKLQKKLQEIKNRKRIGLMTHVVIGYPSLDETIKIVKTMADCCVDFVELQVPFSDPLADGPTIMKACEKSLENGFKVKDAFTVMKSLSSEINIPLLFMAYYNTVFKYGTRQFCKDAKKAGASGIIVPDVPIEEESKEHFIQYCKEYDLANIRIVSPSSTTERLKKNAQVGSGFVYATALQGITGAREDLNTKLSYLETVRKYFSIPIAVGFGISKKEHLKTLTNYADIAIIGSAIIKIINESTKKNMLPNIRNFLRMI